MKPFSNRPPSPKAFRCFPLLLPHSSPQTAFFEGFPLLPPASSAQQAADRLLRRLSAASAALLRLRGRSAPSVKANTALHAYMRFGLSFPFLCCAELVLHVEAEEDDVSVLYDVVFSLQAYQAFFSGCRQ